MQMKKNTIQKLDHMCARHLKNNSDMPCNSYAMKVFILIWQEKERSRPF